MELGEFYYEIEKYILAEMYGYLKSQNGMGDDIRILSIYDGTNVGIKMDGIMTIFDIGSQISKFLDRIQEYRRVIGYERYDIVNCSFVIKKFMINAQTLDIFLRFVSDSLKKDGYMIGFLLDSNIVNRTFMRRMQIEDAPYKLEYITQYDEDVSHMNYTLKINDDRTDIIKDKYLVELCKMHGLKFSSSTNIKKIKKKCFDNIKLNKRAKKYSYLNRVYIFQKYK